MTPAKDQFEAIAQEDVSADRLQDHLVEFSTLFRDSGTEDERQAASYIAEQLTSFGLNPETLWFRSYISWPREGTLSVLEHTDTVTDVPVRTRSFGGRTPEAGLTAELVFVPFEAPAKGEMIFSHRAVAGDYGDRDVAGKIVLTSDGGPDGIRRAEERGAAAHIHIWPSDEEVIHEMIATPVWGTPTTRTAANIPNIPALGLTQADGQRLRDLLDAGTVTVTMTSQVETGWMDLPLVVADIPGTENDRFLLAGSHIDSWYEGVTDNATGDAAVLELARVLSRHREHLRYGVRFAWWPGHSTGRYSGSTWYADTYFNELRERALGYLNIDSPGSRGATIWDCRYNCGEIEAVTDAVVQELSGQEPNIRRPLKAGDQSFLGVGLPSLGAFRMLTTDHPDRKAVGGCGGGWWWHTPADTLDKADKQVLAEDTRLALTMVLRMCTPLLHPYDFVPVADDFVNRNREYETAAGDHFDFAEVSSCADMFRTASVRLREAAASATDRASVERLNSAFLRLSRLVNPALFTIAGPYDFDPALQLPVLPGLARTADLTTLEPGSNEYLFLKTELVRQRNRIVDTLRTATQVIEMCLEMLSIDR